MATPAQCVRCHGHEIAAATLEGAALGIVTEAGARSAVDARVCLACGAVMLTAREPGKLRSAKSAGEPIQEYDF
ncbi:MAG: hypothetical protein HOP12_01860 [Candidatus Eisenbacteria bacterium]|uniref:Uncharacterized protein n=1 Tax=Eiseniibacteriota bacterium TaxID=2212470 RepID=A0A849SLX7_UNCEI|nr:hypothetical protein [Candidatus Eisenbacteria bacterium]